LKISKVATATSLLLLQELNYMIFSENCKKHFIFFEVTKIKKTLSSLED